MRLGRPTPARHRAGAARSSFTLVELLVVIAIIGVLVGLLLAAVFKVLDAAYEAQTRADVSQLSAAVQAFETQYKVPYIPSRIILCKNYLNYFNNQNPQLGYITPLHQDSVEYLSRVFPSVARPTMGQALPQWAIPNPNPLPQYYTGIDWNLTGNLQDYPPQFPWSVYPAGNLPIVGNLLEGEQCLVFFLGGIPQYNGPNAAPTPVGFSTNPTNPAVGTDRVPSFFEFKSNRLVYLPGTFNQVTASQNLDPGFPSYLDGYGKTAYAYFSSYKNSNGYNRYVQYSNPNMPASGPPITSDCQALGVFPYIQASLFPYPPQPPASPPGPATPPSNIPVYLNSQTFQIISAGKNYAFGPGCQITGYPGYGPSNAGNWYGAPLSPSTNSPLWTPSTASTLSGYGQGQAGYDDISNFYERLLGVSP
jgi:prepilin-type N-terminal cleavage/methylation domain-containing protein